MEGQIEKPPLHPAMFTKLVEISEQNFDLNDYAEGLQHFEQLLAEYGNKSPDKQKDFFADTHDLLVSAVSLRPAPKVTPGTVSPASHPNPAVVDAEPSQNHY